jgi:hypothetical protein
MPKEVKDEHVQEFLKVLKEELKKDKAPQDPRIEHILEKQKAHGGRGMPPSMILQRLEHFNRRRNRETPEEETWIALARTVYEQWEAETYPEEIVPIP